MCATKPKYQTLLGLAANMSVIRARNLVIKSLGSTAMVVLACFILGILWYTSITTNPRSNNEHMQRELPTIVMPALSPSPLPKRFACFDKSNAFRIEQKGDFWALYNYIPASKWFACHESVTYTTMGDPTFLDNLKPLVERWRGPISVALYTPGGDMETAIGVIAYLRYCESPLLTEYVSFHFYFESEHRPPTIPRTEDVLLHGEKIDCEASSGLWSKLNASNLYRSQKNLLFPINVGRNVARDAATTHFILASDIELYPSENVIKNFLVMIRENEYTLRTSIPSVFVLPPFEVKAHAKPPSTKTDLKLMLRNRSAIMFHEKICGSCHRVPNYDKWVRATVTDGLHVFHTAKKRGLWEPFYIGTNKEPYFDERLTWEGRCNKLTQAYSMCILNYDFHILDNAFLVHKPGIKKYETDSVRERALQKNIQRIRYRIERDILALYGKNENCTKQVWYG